MTEQNEQTETAQDAPHPFAVGDRLRPIQDDDGRLNTRPVLVTSVLRRSAHGPDVFRNTAVGAPMIEYRYEHEIEAPTFAVAPADRFEPIATWTSDPYQFLRDVGEDAVRGIKDSEQDNQTIAIAARIAAVESILGSFVERCGSDTPLDVVRLLRAVATGLTRDQRGSNEWLSFGKLAAPASPNGIGALRLLRNAARTFAQGAPSALYGGEDTNHKLARFVTAHAVTAQESEVFGRLANLSAVSPDRTTGLTLTVNLDASIMHSLPRGENLPRPVLSELEGRTIDGDTVLEIARKASMCDDGVAEFLDDFGVDYERNSGSYECDSCGGETESGEDGEFESCDDLTLDANMIQGIREAGFLEAVLEALDADDGSDDLEALLDSCDDEDLASQLAPADKVKSPTLEVDPKDPRRNIEKMLEKGIVYDPKVWKFTPAFDQIEGVEELDYDYLARLLPALTMSCVAHESRGVLPAVPGNLERISSYGRSTKSSVFAWNPTKGTLTHSPTSDGMAVQFDVRGGATALISKDEFSTDRTLVSGVDDKTNSMAGTVALSVANAGQLVGVWFPLAQTPFTL